MEKIRHTENNLDVILENTEELKGEQSHIEILSEISGEESHEVNS
jgi:hypothetical protein